MGLVPEGLGEGAYSLGWGFLCSPVLLPLGALGEGLCLPRTGRPSQHLLFSRFYSGVAQGALHASHTTNWNGDEDEGPQSVKLLQLWSDPFPTYRIWVRILGQPHLLGCLQPDLGAQMEPISAQKQMPK